MLELRRLLDDIEAMSREIVTHRQDLEARIEDGLTALQRLAVVDDALLDKIDRAATEDPSWRGAFPLGPRLDERHRPRIEPVDATLIGVDGSQIYPDRHGPVLYYLINTGAIVLRQGSGQAPLTQTRPTLFFREDALYNEDQEIVDHRIVNAARELAEIREMALQAVAERDRLGGDLDRLLIVLGDGPLLMWIGEKDSPDHEGQRRVAAYLADLATMQRVGAVPVGYVDRPRSANVLRMLHVADLDLPAVVTANLRATRYRHLTDRALFERWLGPNERSGLFSSTARLNRVDFRQAGQEIAFFYLNVARAPGPEAARIVRVDVPVWVAEQPDLLDRVQLAIYRDCEGMDYPYVLARAHELAVVGAREREELEQMLTIALLRRGVIAAPSAKALAKRLL
jgi:hypothetical protein